jgi:quercetin dioxygenase-like cupin family protein
VSNDGDRPREGDETLDVFEQMALSLRPAELSAALRTRMRAQVIEQARTAGPAGTRTVRAANAAWTDLAPGLQVRVLSVDEAAGRQTVLLRMQPGAVIPPHRHTDDEEFIVLEGECSIGEHRLVTGDFHVAAAGSWHEQTTTRTGVLIMLRGEYPELLPARSR